MARKVVVAAALLAILLLVGSARGETAAAVVELQVDADSARVGDPIPLRLVVDLEQGTALEPGTLGPELGPFTVISESWTGPEDFDGKLRWIWEGSLVAFRTGELELPSIRVQVVPDEGEPIAVETPVRTITIASVLDESEDVELSDLKPPASVPADYGALVAAGSILGVLLLISLVFWWLHRRYGAGLAGVASPDDPFHRTPPDVWIYAELQKLLDRRLAEQGQVDLFFSELARTVKLYLTGRYRIDLMERTTSELPPWLRRSGVSGEWIEEIHALFESCDRVKFAGHVPEVDDCRAVIERTYRIVDATKPQAERVSADGVA